MIDRRPWGFLQVLDEGFSDDESYSLKKVVVSSSQTTDTFNEQEIAALIVISGRGTMKQSNQDHPLSMGCFCVIPPGDKFSFSCSGDTPLVVLVVLTAFRPASLAT
jgi:mannose-6-phosphate isomerase-like protein (cupin superfamily)